MKHLLLLYVTGMLSGKKYAISNVISYIAYDMNIIINKVYMYWLELSIQLIM